MPKLLAIDRGSDESEPGSKMSRWRRPQAERNKLDIELIKVKSIIELPGWKMRGRSCKGWGDLHSVDLDYFDLSDQPADATKRREAWEQPPFQSAPRGAQTFLCLSAVVSAEASTVQQPPDQNSTCEYLYQWNYTLHTSPFSHIPRSVPLATVRCVCSIVCAQN